MTTLSRPKLMVVEDDPDLLSLYRDQISQDHFDVSFFDNARHALENYRSRACDFDLIITDLKMQTKGGEGLIFDLKYLRPQQAIAVLSAEARSLSVPPSFGVTIFEKPLSIKDVLRDFFPKQT